MARKEKTQTKRPVETYEHRDKERLNNPPVGLVTPDTDPDTGQKAKNYAYDPHLDPQLVWAGKAEHTSFQVPTVSLHVHERIDPRTIIELCANAMVMTARAGRCRCLKCRRKIRRCARLLSFICTPTAGATGW